MVRPRGKREPDLAHDLRPHVKRSASLFPFRKWQRRPDFVATFVLRRNHLCRSCGSRSVPINEILEGAVHSLEHVSRFVLSAPESLFDPRLGAADDAASLFGVSFCVTIGFYFLHASPGEHSLGARDSAAVRPDINSADRTRGFILQRNNPDGIALLIGAQRVTDNREARVRFFGGMTGDGIGAVGVEI